jgi:hypothetical protein
LAYVVALVLMRHIFATAEIYHFQPYIALFFCLAATRRGRWLWVPAVGYFLSTIIAVGGVALWMLAPILAFALIIGLGRVFSKTNNWMALLGGSLGGATIFYFVTNAISWVSTGLYSLTATGFVQAMWTGLPNDAFPPTWMFFRNDVISTLLFSGIFLLLQSLPEREERAAVPVRS